MVWSKELSLLLVCPLQDVVIKPFAKTVTNLIVTPFVLIFEFVNLWFIVYNIILDRNPERIIAVVTTPKKIAISLKDITFFSKVACGKDNPTVAIIKAMANLAPFGTLSFSCKIYEQSIQGKDGSCLEKRKGVVKAGSSATF